MDFKRCSIHKRQRKGLFVLCLWGGSTMGYKLAGFDVIGCNEIDKRMMDVYRQNHNPQFPFLEPIQDFKNREDLPPELYDLNILDGSPPCSSFPIAGSREKTWGKKKRFREGQAEQVLDTLFFDFIDVAKRLQPRVVVAENVKGLLIGNAKAYVQRIYQAFEDAGYICQHWLLNAQTMGVPQRRERVFFVCLRRDLLHYVPCTATLFEEIPRLELYFNEPVIPMRDVSDYQGREIVSPEMRKRWNNRQQGDANFGDVTKRIYRKELRFNTKFSYPDKVCATLTGKECSNVHFDHPRYLSQSEICRISTFPSDYNFCGNKSHYIVGMSVPPVMMAQIASAIWEQWLSRMV